MNLESLSDGLLSCTIMSLLGICDIWVIPMWYTSVSAEKISFLVPLECMQ